MGDTTGWPVAGSGTSGSLSDSPGVPAVLSEEIPSDRHM